MAFYQCGNHCSHPLGGSHAGGSEKGCRRLDQLCPLHLLGGAGAELLDAWLSFCEFPRETSIILRCAGKAGNPFHTK